MSRRGLCSPHLPLPRPAAEGGAATDHEPRSSDDRLEATGERMKVDKDFDFLVRAAAIPPGQSGVLLSVTPEEAGWDTLGFTARRLVEGEVWKGATGDHEAAIVVLGGKMTIDWGDGPQSIGQRE